MAIDDCAPGVMVGEHLASLGHRDITAPRRDQPTGRSPGRRLDAGELGYVDYAARVGLRQAMPGQIMIVSGGHNSIESGTTARWLLIMINFQRRLLV